MREPDARAFASLFRDVYLKCFANELTSPLTESESHHLSVEISESTGREIGWKSLKNYSHYVLGSAQGKPENPSTPTLDILARYVAGARATDQSRSEKDARHHPYWFRYKEAFQQSHRRGSDDAPVVTRQDVPVAQVAGALGIALAALLLIATLSRGGGAAATFTDAFDAVTDEALATRGWSLWSMDTAHWARRGARPGHLTLFTLSGDNWPHADTAPSIKNLLVRETASRCFVTEVRLTAFFPRQNWQQAGILVLEDTSFAGKTLRMSIGYNDFAGGFPEIREIIIQAVTTAGRDLTNPEEIAHHRLFVVEPGTAELIGENLEHAALRIEKRGPRYRLLYAAGPMENAAFREVVSTELDMRPTYVAVFALKGFVNQADDMPVHVDAFSLTGTSCDD